MENNSEVFGNVSAQCPSKQNLGRLIVHTFTTDVSITLIKLTFQSALSAKKN